jgi:hypothetical protein
MSGLLDELDDPIATWIERQHLFFVATAAAEGHVNLSPKGLDTFAVLDRHRVAYLDLTGSGVETIAHIRDNGRITVMFCAFDGAPRILRLFGTGQVHYPDSPEFAELAGRFPEHLGTRSVITVDVDRIHESCGYGIPIYQYQGERRALDAWAEKKGVDGLVAYRESKNSYSIDGLPGLAHSDASSSRSAG